jgi:hypothetical protein
LRQGLKGKQTKKPAKAKATPKEPHPMDVRACLCMRVRARA